MKLTRHPSAFAGALPPSARPRASRRPAAAAATAPTGVHRPGQRGHRRPARPSAARSTRTGRDDAGASSTGRRRPTARRRPRAERRIRDDHDPPSSASLTGLTPGTTYHYRLDATSSAGTTDGERRHLHDRVGSRRGHRRRRAKLTTTSATLNGTVDPNGEPTTLLVPVRHDDELRVARRRARARAPARAADRRSRRP